jgi:hypothetical protein
MAYRENVNKRAQVTTLIPMKVNFKTRNILKVTDDRLIMMRGKVNLTNILVITS